VLRAELLHEAFDELRPKAGAAGTSFLRANTRLGHAALVPEIALHLATEITPIWQVTEDWLRQNNIAPPFWAFAWPGSQLLARHVLDHPELVAGRRVLDFAAGGGLAAIACARAGAASVETAEIDPLAITAIRCNAAENRVVLTVSGDVVGQDCRWDLILCGDVCYEAPMTGHILPWLRAMAAAGAEVWLADPGRAYVPRDGLVELARFEVPVTRELEDRDHRLVTICRLQRPAEGPARPAR